MKRNNSTGTSRARDNRANSKKPIEQYDHRDKKRVNIPPVGLVTPDTDPVEPPRKKYQYDPHFDPQLVWAGRAERLSFEVPTVSLHVHERIDPKTIIAAVRSKNGNGSSPSPSGRRSSIPSPSGRRSSIPSPSGRRSSIPSPSGRGQGEGAPAYQLPLFARPEENPPLRDAVEFYRHKHNWTNRLIAGVRCWS